MILKNKNTEFNIKLQETNSNIGLNEKDKWHQIEATINNQDISIHATKELLSKEEIIELITEIKNFLSVKKSYKQRITFIKKYITVTLIANRKKEKIMKIKLIHINQNITNYDIILNEKEIIELLNILEKRL